MAMTYLRLPASFEGGNDPARAARAAFGNAQWRTRHQRAQLLDVADKWQGLHYLITGDPWDGARPGADVVCGGPLLTEDQAMCDELGMDVIYLSPERVKLAAEFLSVTPFDSISYRFDCRRMAALQIQSADEWLNRPVAEVRDRDLKASYEHLTMFYGAAAGGDEAVFKSMVVGGG